MSLILKVFLSLFLSIPVIACMGGNQSSIEIRGAKIGTLIKNGKGQAVVYIQPFYFPLSVKIAERIHGRERVINTLQDEWDYSEPQAKIGIDSYNLKNDVVYFKIDIHFKNSRRKAGSIRIDKEELFRIARGQGCGGVIKGY